MASDPVHLFVYGTLKIGCKNPTARFLHSTQKHVGKAHFPGKLFRVSFYPGAVYVPESDNKVYGDLFEITSQRERLFSVLDEYEGIGNTFDAAQEFKRKTIPVHYQGEQIPTLSYLFDQDYSSYPLIESGNFEIFE
ncbi:gamma-glutamylcyclotransferase family protein [Gracilimonas mengyeensis]|uniref:Uncharacterized conserved protein YtfP, gamma-glutamylcyclotransferase (GGCT)/AIG2-like family n=1 Tax=Gracilimonas mengyeensis TaxID=1302730 RepID=A0A521FCQ5_9BACT|nr:gamma-glutamylcyclotransferase family protein [Gracilimonas mengyeensis]SMO93946.1 Uncharacterized conserved protein YtfP, gamma-glutamylcyclotransferase (GGCT)/AIG2-like family [Gracilimonas mengyeensis]